MHLAGEVLHLAEVYELSARIARYLLEVLLAAGPDRHRMDRHMELLEAVLRTAQPAEVVNAIRNEDSGLSLRLAELLQLPASCTDSDSQVCEAVGPDGVNAMQQLVVYSAFARHLSQVGHAVDERVVRHDADAIVRAGCSEIGPRGCEAGALRVAVGVAGRVEHEYDVSLLRGTGGRVGGEAAAHADALAASDHAAVLLHDPALEVNPRDALLFPL